MNPKPPSPGTTMLVRSKSTTVDAIDSRTLLGGRDTVAISHHGELYRLRLTRQGKLILTK
jgi:hemin uptake protein HemP